MPVSISCAAFDAPPQEFSPGTTVAAVLDWAWATFQQVPTLQCDGRPLVPTAHRLPALLADLVPAEEIPSSTLRWLLSLICPLDRPIGELVPWSDNTQCALVPGCGVLRRITVEVQGLGTERKPVGCFAHHTVAELKGLLVQQLGLWCPATSLQLWQSGSELLDHMVAGDLPAERMTMSYLSASTWAEKFVLQLSPAPNEERLPQALAIELTVTTSRAGSQLPVSLVAGVGSLEMQLYRVHPVLYRPLDQCHPALRVWDAAEAVTTWLGLTCRHPGLGRDLLGLILDFLRSADLQPRSRVPSTSAVTVPQADRVSRVLVPQQPLRPKTHYMVTTTLPPTGPLVGYAMQLKRSWHFYTGPPSTPAEVRDAWTTDLSYS